MECQNKRQKISNCLDNKEIQILSDFDIIERNLFDYVNNLYPCMKNLFDEYWYQVKNFGHKYDIYEKEIEDLSFEFDNIEDPLIKRKWYGRDFVEKYEGVPIIIDGNKLIIYANWCENIEDEVITLILAYEIDILIIKDMDFNDQIYKIPNRIKSLKIYSNIFNEPVDLLPINLKILCIKGSGSTSARVTFNQPVNNLPFFLEELVIYSYSFNQPVNNLPYKLSKLYIGGQYCKFNKPVNNLPVNLKTLCICSDYFTQKLNKLPSKLELLFIEYHTGNVDALNNLPPNLKTLYYGFYELNLDKKKPYSINNLPKNIENIHLGSSFNNSIDNLPESVIGLYIGDEDNNFSFPINNLPQNLKSIYIYNLSEHIDYIDLNSVPLDIYKTSGCYALTKENFIIAKKVFSNLDNNQKNKILRNLQKIINWNEIGYQMSRDI